jgi:hypothetical protein
VQDILYGKFRNSQKKSLDLLNCKIKIENFGLQQQENGATTLSVTTFRIMTFSIRSFYVTLSISDSQHKQNSIIMLCYYAVCRILFTIMLNVVLLSVVAPKFSKSGIETIW